MCGISAYIGNNEAGPILVESLRKMEYRGYDSAGIATIAEEKLIVKKHIGRLEQILDKVDMENTPGKIGISHTRWATHGEVNILNTHPHVSCNSDIAIAHNAIIDNYQELLEELQKKGHKILTETDSEIIVHLLEENYKKSNDEIKAVQNTVKNLKGSFALVAIFKNNPNKVIGAKKDAPLIIGIDKEQNFIASDVLAFIKFTDRVIFLEDEELAIITKDSVKVTKFDGSVVKKKKTHVSFGAANISKEEFAHHTIKEIKEQNNTIIESTKQDNKAVEKFIENITKSKAVYITACGSSYHAGLIFRQLLMKMCKIPAQAFLSSESHEYIDIIDKDSVIICLSQSGETADLLDVIKHSKKKGAKILSIVNTKGSSVSRLSDVELQIKCGPEIGVAATKSFTSELIVIYNIILRISHFKGNSLSTLSKSVDKIMEEKNLKEIIEFMKEAKDVYYVGRGIHYPIALEGALKLKELSYIHAEGMAAGELKHGTLALIDERTPVVVINPEDETYNDTLNNVSEMKARGAIIIGISNKNSKLYDHFIELPKLDHILYPIIEIIPLQLFAYYTAVERQNNPDYPRNLAKSVTVK